MRRNAIYALGLLGIEKALPLLTFVLRDSSVQIDEQIAATLALGLIGSDPAADALQESMKRTPAVRDLQAATLHALGFVDSVKARVFLKHYFYRSSIDPNLRAIALGSLGKQGVDGAVEILSESLSHKEVMVRRSAALALGSIDFKGTWASDLAEHRRELRGAVSASTGRRLVEEQIANFLVAAEVSAYRTRDRLFADRRMASDALVRVGLKDSDETVRNFSAIALGQVGDSMSLSVLRKAFVDSSSRSFQAHAALALGIADATLGGPDLLTALEHRTLDQVTRAAVILAAGLKEHEAATRRIAREFKTRADASTSGAAAVALGLLGYRDEIPRLRRSVLSTSRPELKPDYGVALSLLGDAKSVRGLGKLVRSRRSSSARIQSVRALSAMRDATSLKLLVKATLSNGVGDMVLAVSVRALGTLAERGTLPVTSEFYRHLNHTLSVGHLSFFASL